MRGASAERRITSHAGRASSPSTTHRRNSEEAMATPRPDLYAILEVHPNATQAEIGYAYRSLLRRHHPDTRALADAAQGALADATLQRVLAAYRVLGDPSRRADYDQHVRPPTRPASQPQPPRTTTPGYHTDGQPPLVAGPVRWHHA